ncbi:hypothetical protein DCC81_14275 [Chitinophaga parva]|uniref:Uncharacterized protein n=1 Tax=Chitinophaga parva TaxID=2169414 RepID=A0A2T7BGT3_9BACT|nr:hypothetical protein [Chitinophaga parva]PUZ25453.1 hypothetical protein DCC81_14275 [Chitinophaga parva]
MKRLLKILYHYLNSTRKHQQTDLLLLGTLLSRQNKQLPVLDSLGPAEFKVFSQAGDDGIIQYLINKIDIRTKTFIEFGVEDYVESNTRFLLRNDNWSGLVIDGSSRAIDYIRADDIFYRYDLKTLQAFITAENINELIASQGMRGETGLLSIDIDGNDYWVWKALDVVQPVIVIVEYNSVFGPERPVTVPYQPGFTRSAAHYSHLYFGASLAALCQLAEEKGYAFVGSNTYGNNAYFVRKERVGPLKIFSVAEGYVESRFRESRDRKGRLNFLSGAGRLASLRGLPVFNTSTGQTEAL